MESEEEGRGGRRRLRRLCKSNVKRKLMEGASQEDDLDFEDLGCPKRRMKGKIVNFGVGGTEEVEEEISKSSRLDLGDGKENKEVSHVSAIVKLGCVDLTKDQFLDTIHMMPSPTMIYSLIKAISINSTNPLVV